MTDTVKLLRTAKWAAMPPKEMEALCRTAATDIEILRQWQDDAILWIGANLDVANLTKEQLKRMFALMDRAGR